MRTISGILRFVAIVNAVLVALPAVGAEIPLPKMVADGAKLVSVYQDERFFEGPAWDPKTKKLYFTAFPKEPENTQILRLDAPGKVTVWLDKTEGVNGMYFSRDGRLLGAQAFGHRVVSYEIGENGPAQTEVLVFDKDLFQPNDLAEARNGDIYFTDPDFKKKQGSAVYLLPRGGQPVKIIEDMQVPNGVIVSNDGKTLYVADDGTRNWRSYPIHANGHVGPGKVFFNAPTDKAEDPDGMTIDLENNLYLSRGTYVWVTDKFGKLLGGIPVPEFCSNVTFGGADGKTLYLTCSKQVYSLQMNVRGDQKLNAPPKK